MGKRHSTAPPLWPTPGSEGPVPGRGCSRPAEPWVEGPHAGLRRGTKGRRACVQMLAPSSILLRTFKKYGDIETVQRTPLYLPAWFPTDTQCNFFLNVAERLFLFLLKTTVLLLPQFPCLRKVRVTQRFFSFPDVIPLFTRCICADRQPRIGLGCGPRAAPQACGVCDPLPPSVPPSLSH